MKGPEDRREECQEQKKIHFIYIKLSNRWLKLFFFGYGIEAVKGKGKRGCDFFEKSQYSTFT